MAGEAPRRHGNDQLDAERTEEPEESRPESGFFSYGWLATATGISMGNRCDAWTVTKLPCS